ncbi:hypothetical protein ACRARG_15645 [Pseudooceanicola sp. C21-150M6]|uniref:hypothetical protein n=1 Tax=Pseudooceanicola sp. C21-150M6 TaxID=3434355 RepID=UPI003D7F4978
MTVILLSLLPAVAHANKLDVQILENEFGGCQAAWYLSGKVSGLKAGGDGFLAVRTGPGSDYRKIDEVHNGDDVYIFDKKGKWLGVSYNMSYRQLTCSENPRYLNYPYMGWVHENWIKINEAG